MISTTLSPQNVLKLRVPPHNHAIPLLNELPKEMCACDHQEIRTRLITVLFVIAIGQKQCRCPSTVESIDGYVHPMASLVKKCDPETYTLRGVPVRLVNKGSQTQRPQTVWFIYMKFKNRHNSSVVTTAITQGSRRIARGGVQGVRAPAMCYSLIGVYMV